MSDAEYKDSRWQRFKVFLEESSPLTAEQELLAKLSSLAVVVTISFAIMGLVNSFWPKPEQPDIAERIKTLTSSLNSAAKTIAEIEEQIKQREELVHRLQSDAEIAKKLTELNKPQLDAVAQVLKGEIEKDERQKFWTAQALAVFYTLLGVALAEFYRWIVGRLRPKRIV